MDSRSEKNISTSRERAEQEHKWRDMIKRREEIEGPTAACLCHDATPATFVAFLDLGRGVH